MVCEFCVYETISEINLIQHEKDVHLITKRKLSCNKCNHVLETSTKLEEHMKRVHSSVNFPCGECNFVAGSDSELNNHLGTQHKFTRVNGNRSGYSTEDRKRNGICYFWNNGSCNFEDRCRYSHEEMPFCRFDGYCRNNKCRFFHVKSNPSADSSSFLYRRGLQNNPYQNQGRHFREAQRGQGPRK